MDLATSEPSVRQPNIKAPVSRPLLSLSLSQRPVPFEISRVLRPGSLGISPIPPSESPISSPIDFVAAMAVNLTRNAIAAVMGGDLNLKPLVQVLDIRSVRSAQERFRLVVSDGGCTQPALLAAQLNDRVKSGALQKGSVVQLIEYVCSSVQNTQ